MVTEGDRSDELEDQGVLDVTTGQTCLQGTRGDSPPEKPTATCGDVGGARDVVGRLDACRVASDNGTAT